MRRALSRGERYSVLRWLGERSFRRSWISSRVLLPPARYSSSVGWVFERASLSWFGFCPVLVGRWGRGGRMIFHINCGAHPVDYLFDFVFEGFIAGAGCISAGRVPGGGMLLRLFGPLGRGLSSPCLWWLRRLFGPPTGIGRASRASSKER